MHREPRPSPGIDRNLPPLAKAQAMDRPYKPGQRLRQGLIGALVVAGMLGLFLTLMPPIKPRVVARAPVAAAPPTPGVMYQNLRSPPAAPLPARAADPAPQAKTGGSP